MKFFYTDGTSSESSSNQTPSTNYISKILVEGGCNEWRTLELINNTHAKLIEMYPNYISWNGIRENVMGGDFKKIKIKWKKMFTDSQSSSLEEFFV